MYYARWEIPGTKVSVTKIHQYLKMHLKSSGARQHSAKGFLYFTRQFISPESLNVWAFHQLFFCKSKNVQIIHLRNKRKKKSRFWCYQLKHFRKTKGKGEHVNLSAGDRTIETLCSADCTHGHSPKYIYSIILYTRVASVCRHSSVRASASSDGFSNSK